MGDVLSDIDVLLTTRRHLADIATFTCQSRTLVDVRETIPTTMGRSKLLFNISSTTIQENMFCYVYKCLVFYKSLGTLILCGTSQCLGPGS